MQIKPDPELPEAEPTIVAPLETCGENPGIGQ